MAEEYSEFAIAMCGYDRAQVDRRLEQLLHQLADTCREMASPNQRAMTLAGELADTQRRLRESDKPTYTGLGSRIERLLCSTEEQSTSVLPKANAEADALLTRTWVSTKNLSKHGASKTAALLADARREASELRSRSQGETSTALANAEVHAQELVSSAPHGAAQISADAEAATTEMRVNTEREAALALSQTHKQAAEIAITSERDATTNREAVVAETGELHKTSTAKVEEILSAVKQEVELTVGKAKREAEEILTSTRNEPETLRRLATDEAVVARSEATGLCQQTTLEIVAAHEQVAQEDSDVHEVTYEHIREVQGQARAQAREAEGHLREALPRAGKVRIRTNAKARKHQGEAVSQAEETPAQARLKAEQIISGIRADADVTAQIAVCQLRELERRRDSVAACLIETCGVLGDALPQAPSFSDHVAALSQEPSLVTAPGQASAQSAESAAFGSVDSPHSTGSGSASSAPSATLAAPAPVGNKVAAVFDGGRQTGAQLAPKNAQEDDIGRTKHVPAPGKSSGAPGNSTNCNPHQGKGRRRGTDVIIDDVARLETESISTRSSGDRD